MIVNETTDFIFENYYKRIKFSKENSYYSIKRQGKKNLQLFSTKLKEKTPDPRNAKEHHQLFLRNEIIKSVKKLKIITHQLKTF